MIAEILKYKEFGKVTYYTIQIEGRPQSELADFLQRMDNSAYKSELQEVIRFIIKIGNEYGAKKEHFRHERKAEALPPQYYHYIAAEPDDKEYGLRLYCLRLTDQVVLLLNGDMKTDFDPEKCDNCRPHFRLANKLSQKINEAIYPDKTLRVVGKQIITNDFFQLDL